jgi:hypothetical protein
MQVKFPGKSINSNNFWTVRDEQKVPTDRLYKIRIGESTGHVISAAGYLPVDVAAKTTSGPFERCKNREYSVKVIEIDEIDQTLQYNSNRKLMSGYWIGDIKFTLNLQL